MLVACRLAGLSALETHYAGLVAVVQSQHDYAARRARHEALRVAKRGSPAGFAALSDAEAHI
jgi:hypothetical protein